MGFVDIAAVQMNTMSLYRQYRCNFLGYDLDYYTYGEVLMHIVMWK